MRRRRMGVLNITEPRLNFQIGRNSSSHGAIAEEIEGLIRVYRDGHVDRLPAIPDVPCTYNLSSEITSSDVVISRSTGIWARLYVPRAQDKLPVLVYFHGGGFCVGSAAWSCYHEFLARLAMQASCIVVSVNYRLAPEHRLPAAYEDGLTAMKWLRQQADFTGSDELSWWRNRCSFAHVFLAGDSAGAAIAYQVAAQIGSLGSLKSLCVKGVVLIQPFFGGESRTASEKNMAQPSRSALTLPTSDCYWRMSLPVSAGRDHPWCNPLAKGSPKLEQLSMPPLLVCISEMDILKDRNLEFCKALKKAGKSVEQVLYAGVGHAFQILHNHHLSQPRTQEMLAHIKNFISSRQA